MNTRTQTEEHEKKRKDIVRTFIVGLGTLFVCQCYVFLSVQLPFWDFVILGCCLASVVCMQIGIYLRVKLLLEILHILFLLFVFILIPCFAQSVHLLGLNVICVLVTLAIRAEHSGCALRVLESPEKRKPYDNWIVDQMNFNLLFTFVGIICIIRIIMQYKIK